MIKLIEIQCTLPPKFSMDWTLAGEHLLLPCPFLYFFLVQIPNAAKKRENIVSRPGTASSTDCAVERTAFFSLFSFFSIIKNSYSFVETLLHIFFPD